MRLRTSLRDKWFSIIFIILMYCLMPAVIVKTPTKSELMINSNFPISNIILTECEITFNLGFCRCNRSIRANLPQICPKKFPDAEEVLKKIKASFGETICGDWATLRGPNQRVASYSIYGPFLNDYYLGIEYILPRLLKTFPGWNMRLYHHMNLSNPRVNEWICGLACQYPHFDLCNSEKLPILGNITNSTGRAWRFAALGDKFVERFIVRDTDSPIYQREVDAVQEWISEGTCFHVMRDHPWHNVPVPGGLWGGCNTWKPQEVLDIAKSVFRSANSTRSDQGQVSKRIYPLARQNGTIHDSYSCNQFRGTKPFPTQRYNDTYVGQKSLLKYFRRRALRPCPVNCRPKKHEDWLYC